MDWIKRNRWSLMILGYLTCLVGVVALVVWGSISPSLASPADSFVPTYFHQGWSQHIGEKIIPLEDLQDYVHVPAGKSLVFTCTLPELDKGDVMLFHSKNKEVACFVDGALIQDFRMQTGYSMLKTPGSTWNQVDLQRDMSGKVCTLVFTSPLGQYDSLCKIYLVENQYVNTMRIQDLWGGVLLAVELLILTVIFLTASVVWKQSHRKRYLFSIAQFFAVTLMWILGELNFYDIFFGRPVLSFLLAQAFKRMIPLVLLRLTKNSTNQYWHPQLFLSIYILAWANMLVPFFLQFAMGISLLESAVLHTLSCGVIMAVLMGILVEKMVRFRRLTLEEYPCLAVPILIVTSMIDVIVLNMNGLRSPVAGVWTSMGILLFSYVTFAIFLHINSKVEREKQEIEQAYHALENTTLVCQIKAHFIFNALNTVSALCKVDPPAADRAIVTFAAYLRNYLTLINQRENISFDQEMTLVKHYLAIERSRFGSIVSYSFNTPFTDFVLPPMTVYTLVENAVCHGVRGKQEGGLVTISTKRIGGKVEVTVADTGAGFDTSQPRRDSGVGLKNVEKRLEIMCNGTLDIESTLGEGTKIIMTIPLSQEGEKGKS